jgi:hypothetical protein
MDEAALIRLFVDLTGDSDSAGRSVLMYLDMLEHDYFPNRNPESPSGSAQPQEPPGGPTRHAQPALE